VTPGAIEAALTRHRPRTLPPTRGQRQAAVVVPFVEREVGLSLLFILRPASMPAHAGQVAFPGGVAEPDDEDSWRTATRELHEELGVADDRLRRLGRLDDIATGTGFLVTPWVAWVDPSARIVPAPREVDEVVEVPLRVLADPARRRTMRGRWRADAPAWPMAFYLTDRHVIWGATAHMLTDLLALLARQEPIATR